MRPKMRTRSNAAAREARARLPRHRSAERRGGACREWQAGDIEVGREMAMPRSCEGRALAKFRAAARGHATAGRMTILDDIAVYKREEIARAKRERPEPLVEMRARKASAAARLPRCPARCREGRRYGLIARDQEGEPVEGPDPRRFRSALRSRMPMRRAAPRAFRC